MLETSILFKPDYAFDSDGNLMTDNVTRGKIHNKWLVQCDHMTPATEVHVRVSFDDLATVTGLVRITGI